MPITSRHIDMGGLVVDIITIEDDVTKKKFGCIMASPNMEYACIQFRDEKIVFCGLYHYLHDAEQSGATLRDETDIDTYIVQVNTHFPIPN